MKIQVALGRSRPVGKGQIDVVEAIQPARPTLRRPRFVQFLNGSVLPFEHATNRWRSASEYDMKPFPISLS